MSPPSFAAGQEIEIVLHLGAHKTATTYLQSRLSRASAALLENGVSVVPIRELRETLGHVRRKSYLPNHIAPVLRRRTAAVYQGVFREAVAAGSHRLVISEETLLGSIHPLLDKGEFYQKLGGKLRPVFRGIESRPVTALLALRSYDSFFTSVWSQTVRDLGYRKIDGELKKRLISVRRGWVEIVGDILRVLPAGSRLRIWRFEDFIINEEMVLAALVGPGNVDRVSPLEQRPLARLSEKAVTRLQNLHRLGKPTTADVVARVSKRFAKNKGFPGFSPWTDEERGHLAKRYDDDIARIRTSWPDLMMDTPS